MAKSTTRKDDRAVAANGISDKQLRKIWGEVTPQGFAERLKQAQPGAKWSASGSRITGCCPYHDDKTPSFNVYLDRGYAKCYGCGYFVWNPVSLWARVHNVSAMDALSDLKQSFKLSFLSAAAASKFKDWERRQTMKNRIVSIAHETLIDTINHPEEAPPAAQASATWLTKDRKIPLSALPTFDMVGILPPLGAILDKLDAEAQAENLRRRAEAEEAGTKFETFVSYSHEAREYLSQAAQWVGAVLFRYDIAPGATGRIKLRRANSDLFIFLEESGIEDLGFFGIGWNRYAHLLGPQQNYLNGVHLVEGEFDALTLMGHQVEEFGGPQFVTVAAGGMSTASSVDALHGSCGVEEVYLVGDSTAKGGDALIQAWLMNLTKLRPKIFDAWDKLPGAGDPDEAVLQFGIVPVSRLLLDFRGPGTYATPPEWVLDRASPDLSPVDPSDTRAKVEIASRWGKYLRNPIDCDTFIELCADAYKIPAAVLKRQIVAQEEDQPAFVQRLANFLSKEFFVIGQEASTNGRMLVLWHQEKKTVIRVKVGDEKSIECELAAVFGPLFQFFSERVGVPTFMQWSSKEGPYLQKFDADCRFFAKQAFMVLTQTAPELTGKYRGQGVHVIRGDEPEVYLLNGKEVYYGTFKGDELQWSVLPGPSHNGNIFDVGLKTLSAPWLKSVRSAEDLSRANSVDLRSVYDRLCQMLDLGWCFKHHQTTVKFLAAHVIAASVCSAFKRQPVVGVHAESQSGKSRLLAGMLAGKVPELHVLSSAVGMDVYSSAGIRQNHGDTPRPLILDEFETDGGTDRKAKTNTDVLELIRNLTSEDNTVHFGTRSGKGTTQTLNMFVFLAAITKPGKVQDANRMIQVEMVKKMDHQDPKDLVAYHLGKSFVSNLRNDLDVALLPHIKRIQKEYGEISEYFVNPVNRPKNVESRFLEGLQPALTILKLVGEDYESFVRDFCDEREYDIVRTVDQSEAAQLFTWVTESPQIPVRSTATADIVRLSFKDLLSNPSYRRDINTMGTGLYLDEPRSLLLVNWTQAVQTVLRQHPRYSREVNTFNLREIASRHPSALKPQEIFQSGILIRLAAHGLTSTSLQTISVFRIGKILQSFEVQDDAQSNPSTPITTLNKDQTNVSADYFGPRM